MDLFHDRVYGAGIDPIIKVQCTTCPMEKGSIILFKEFNVIRRY